MSTCVFHVSWSSASLKLLFNCRVIWNISRGPNDIKMPVPFSVLQQRLSNCAACGLRWPPSDIRAGNHKVRNFISTSITSQSFPLQQGEFSFWRGKAFSTLTLVRPLFHWRVLKFSPKPWTKMRGSGQELHVLLTVTADPSLSTYRTHQRGRPLHPHSGGPHWGSEIIRKMQSEAQLPHKTKPWLLPALGGAGAEMHSTGSVT